MNDMDIEFLTSLIDYIAEYAISQNYEIDDTIVLCAEWLTVLPQIATFNNWRKGDTIDDSRTE